MRYSQEKYKRTHSATRDRASGWGIYTNGQKECNYDMVNFETMSVIGRHQHQNVTLTKHLFDISTRLSVDGDPLSQATHRRNRGMGDWHSFGLPFIPTTILSTDYGAEFHWMASIIQRQNQQRISYMLELWDELGLYICNNFRTWQYLARLVCNRTALLLVLGSGSTWQSLTTEGIVLLGLTGWGTDPAVI